MPEIRFGVAGGAAALHRFVPSPLARWMLLTGELVPATTLLEYGSILDVVEEAGDGHAQGRPFRKYGARPNSIVNVHIVDRSFTETNRSEISSIASASACGAEKKGE